MLILEADDHFAGELAAALQSTCGCAIRHGTTGLSGLEMIAERAPDVVIMDLDLPDMDGMGLLMSMRSEESMAGLPVLLLGGRALDDAALEHVNPQLTRWISKTPQENGHLLDAVTTAVLELTV